MYNRYLSSAYEERGRPCRPDDVHMPPPPCDAPPPPPCDAPCPPPHGKPPENCGLLAGLSEKLTGRLQNLHFDLDTIVILLAAYFLLADAEDFDTDLLILIGVLFILGF